MTGAVVLDDVDAERGSRLRRLRRDRQLSQEALGGGRFSASYVSHLEKGRRHLTEEMVDFFAGRLGVARELILDDAPPPASPQSAASAMAHQDVQRAFAQRRFTEAGRTAGEAVREAESRGDLAEAWSLSLLRARALFEDDDFAGASTVAQWCAEHPIASRQPALAVEALLVAARAARADGDLTAALAHADRAASTTLPGEGLDLRAETDAVRIGCLMELDRTGEAVAVADALAAVLDRVPSDHVRGVAQWIVGNVRLLTGDTEDGIARHAQAATLINPSVDLGAWGRFRKAAATVRLEHGVTDGVAELLEEAGFALRIVGSPSDLTGLRLSEARLWLLRGDVERATQLVEYCRGDEEIARSLYSAAELEVLVGDLADTAGDRAEAASAYRRAALRFQEVGSLRRSVEMWMRHSELLTGQQS